MPVSAHSDLTPVHRETVCGTQSASRDGNEPESLTAFRLVLFPDGQTWEFENVQMDIVACLTFHEKASFDRARTPRQRKFHRSQAKHLQKRLASSTMPQWVLTVIQQQHARAWHKASKRRQKRPL